MENMYNATMQSGTSVSGTSNNETSTGVSNPVKRNKMIPPQLNGGLASKEYATAIRSLALAQLNVPKFNARPVYYSF